MKKYFQLLMILFFSATIKLSAQNIGINNTGAAPDKSAMLDVSATNKGMLIPRMTTAQRAAIASPVKGLLVFDNDQNSFWFYDGAAWVQLSGAGNSWGLAGNAGINPATNFIGTTDNQPLRFRINNLWAGEIHPSSGNIFLGLDAGNSSTTGEANVALGEHSLISLTTGTFNTATGYYALNANTTGYNNTSVGTYSLTNNTLGISNTALGRNSLFANNIGSYNIAIGTDALLTNTSGSYNSANGYQALYSNSSGSFNTANGTQVLYANTGGSYNTANGYQALNHNVTGIFNTASGMSGLYFNKDGSYNTADGNNALYHNNGNYNSAIGNNALYNNNIGHDNSAMGNSALNSNSDGNYNTGMGGSALSSNQYGSNNTAIGYFALSSNVNGSNNTAIGYAADVSTVVVNATAIGNGAIVNSSNKIRIGNTSVSVIEGQVAYSFPSDARFKYNIKKNVPGLDFIEKLRPVTYYLNEQKLDEYSRTGIINTNSAVPASVNSTRQLHTGFLAQDVEKIASQLAYEFDGVHKPVNEKDHYSLAYSQFIMPLVKGMQQQQVMIMELKKQIAEMKQEIELLKKKN